MKKVLVILAAAVCLLNGLGFEFRAPELIGYTIVDVKTVADDFEGCDYDKKIIFTDDTYVTCNSYGYSYSYRPKAVIFATQYNGHTLFKMYVNGNVYSIR
ncbi:hypothetical protein [Campylobacter sp. RM16188]|uniref:hypothetical protein n=1 Tax=Campylobacter sp. RM16188 TaxID=1705725 RepID=UPI001553126E|nr:hypothetical protein [Campylobacter sp. RM16188]